MSTPVTVAEDLALLGPLSGLPGEGMTGARAADVVAALGSRRDWLVVFDNAHRPSNFRAGCPAVPGALITSRDRAWSTGSEPANLATIRATITAAIKDAGYLHVPEGRRDHTTPAKALRLE